MSTRTIQGEKNLQDIRQASKDGIGGSPLRPDGTLKVRGEFAYSSDMWHEDMLWGMALRSPHPGPTSSRWTSPRRSSCPASTRC